MANAGGNGSGGDAGMSWLENFKPPSPAPPEQPPPSYEASIRDDEPSETTRASEIHPSSSAVEEASAATLGLSGNILRAPRRRPRLPSTRVSAEIFRARRGGLRGKLVPLGRASRTRTCRRSELGDLPLMKLDTRKLTGAATVDQDVRGSKDIAQCSNHGTCDWETGDCECFTHWTSSDANNSFGYREDCGFFRPT